MNILKKHPFAVEAFFKSSVVLTFAIKKEQLQAMIPECLELDVYQDKWAFIALAMVETKDLRPKGFPQFMGNDFFLLGYRIFVKYNDINDKRLRGLYILKSETDKLKMQYLGNLFTNYKYSKIDIQQVIENKTRTILSRESGIKVCVTTSEGEVLLPEDSPFSGWKDARRFAGPLPFTFTYNKEEKEVLIIEGVRNNWKPQPINIDEYKVDFVQQLGLTEIKLASAFEVKNVPYYWRKGRIEKWN